MLKLQNSSSILRKNSSHKSLFGRIAIIGAVIVSAVSATGISVSALNLVSCEGETGVLATWLPTSGTRATGSFSVSTIDQLYCLGTGTTAANELLDASFTQSADLAWSGITINDPAVPIEWSIIGDDGAPFTGTYDGNNKSVANISWSHPDSASEIGVFGSANNAEIKNLSLLNVNMGAFSNVGGLVGRLTGSSLIDNVQVTGNVSSGQNGDRYVGDYVGGLAGTATGEGANHVTITNSSFDGAVSSFGVRVGGAVGYGAWLDLRGVAVGKLSTTTVTISKGPLASNSPNPNNAGNHSFAGGIAGVLEDSNVDTTTFTGTVTAKNLVGGIVGKISSGTIKRTSASGIVRGRGMTGGIAGWADGARLSDVSSSVTVTQPLDQNDGGGSNANFVGGIAGLIDNSGSITRAINTGSVTGYSYVGGISGSLVLIYVVFDPLGYGGINGSGTIDQSYSIGNVVGTYSSPITSAIVSTTEWGNGNGSAVGSVARSFALAGSSAYSVYSGAIYNRGVFVGGTNQGQYEARIANPFKSATELQTLDTFAIGQMLTTYESNGAIRTHYSTGWNTSGTDGRNVTIVDGWYQSISGHGPHWGICANYNNGYPYLLALEAQMPSGCALTSTAIAPEAPSALEILDTYHNEASVRIRFTPGVTYGQATIQSYQYKVGIAGTWKTLSMYSANLNEGWMATGLLKGVTNIVKVRPVLSIGNATESLGLNVSIEPSDPDAPSDLVAVTGDGSMSLSFTPGIPNGPEITNYMYSLDDGGNWTELSPAQSASPITISGLTRGAVYSVRLRAVNSRNTGGGVVSALLEATMPDLPGVPTSLIATAGDRQASIAFTAGQANNSAIINYEYSIDSGETWTAISPTAASSPLVIAGLVNGTEYSLKIRAVNAIGVGVASDAVVFTPVAIPEAPTSLVATAGNGRVSIAFNAGSSNGSAITGYEYSTDGGSSWIAASPAITTGPLVIAGLTNGAEYSVKIRALNAIGNGLASEPVVFNPIAPVVVTTTTTTVTPATSTAATVTTTTTTTVNTTPPPKEDVVLDLPEPKKPLIADTSLTPGAPVTLTFGGFVPGEFVQLIVASTPRVIASGYADSKGFITLSGDIPASLVSGDHSLALFAPVSGIGIRQPITVAKAVKSLPETGSSTQSNVPISAAVLMVGVVFVAYARRRRSTQLLRQQ